MLYSIGLPRVVRSVTRRVCQLNNNFFLQSTFFYSELLHQRL